MVLARCIHELRDIHVDAYDIYDDVGELRHHWIQVQSSDHLHAEVSGNLADTVALRGSRLPHRNLHFHVPLFYFSVDLKITFLQGVRNASGHGNIDNDGPYLAMGRTC